MRRHGSVTLGWLAWTGVPAQLFFNLAFTSLAISGVAPAQEPARPLPFDPLDRQVVPDLSRQPTGQFRSTMPANGPTALEEEIEALRADLQAFHVASDDLARSARAAEADADRTLLRQRQEMLDILTRLATQRVAPAPKSRDRKPLLSTEATAPVVEDSTDVPAVTDAAVDQFALGKVLFRAGEYAKAEQAFRKVTQTDDNRLMLKYLIATCLRKRSKWQPAIDAYREIAATDKDPVLRDLARFQLDGIRWNQETEKQIEELRKQRALPSANSK